MLPLRRMKLVKSAMRRRCGELRGAHVRLVTIQRAFALHNHSPVHFSFVT
jgi:hypothetical protein